MKLKICVIITEKYNKTVELKSFRGRNCTSFSKFIAKDLTMTVSEQRHLAFLMNHSWEMHMKQYTPLMQIVYFN